MRVPASNSTRSSHHLQTRGGRVLESDTHAPAAAVCGVLTRAPRHRLALALALESLSNTPELCFNSHACAAMQELTSRAAPLGFAPF